MDDTRSNDEKTALHMHRYKSWAQATGAALNELRQLQEQMDAIAERAISSYLEAREEIVCLQELGVTKDQVDAVAHLPPVPMDPLTIVKRSQQRSGLEKVLEKMSTGKDEDV